MQGEEDVGKAKRSNCQNKVHDIVKEISQTELTHLYSVSPEKILGRTVVSVDFYPTVVIPSTATDIYNSPTVYINVTKSEIRKCCPRHRENIHERV